MYMMYPSHPMAKDGDRYYMQPARGSIPQYLEPALAGDSGIPNGIVVPGLLVVLGLLVIPMMAGGSND